VPRAVAAAPGAVGEQDGTARGRGSGQVTDEGHPINGEPDLLLDVDVCRGHLTLPRDRSRAAPPPPGAPPAPAAPPHGSRRSGGRRRTAAGGERGSSGSSARSPAGR